MRPTLALCAILFPAVAAAGSDWQLLRVPGTWDQHAEQFAGYDGFAWYRCKVTVPGGWKGQPIELHVANVDNAHEAYFNGVRIGGAGAFPPSYENGLADSSRYDVPADAVQFGQDQVVAIRVYDREGRGGFKGPAPVLVAGKKAIALNGNWEFRTGDDPDWAAGPTAVTDVAIFWRVMDLEQAREIAARRVRRGRVPIADPPAR